MSDLVQLAIAGDVEEAEEIQGLLSAAGIESEVEPGDESDGLKVLVGEAELEAARDAIETLTEPGRELDPEA